MKLKKIFKNKIIKFYNIKKKKLIKINKQV